MSWLAYYANRGATRTSASDAFGKGSELSERKTALCGLALPKMMRMTSRVSLIFKQRLTVALLLQISGGAPLSKALARVSFRGRPSLL